MAKRAWFTLLLHILIHLHGMVIYQKCLSPNDEKEGEGRDGDFGMKLFYNCLVNGLSINDCAYHQPLLWRKEQKQGLLSGLQAYKQTELEKGLSEQDWQRKYDETIRMINDDKQLIGFYGSCLIAARKA